MNWKVIFRIGSTLNKKINSLVSVNLEHHFRKHLCKQQTLYWWLHIFPSPNKLTSVFFFFFHLKSWMNDLCLCVCLCFLLVLCIESILTNYLKTNAALLIKISRVNIFRAWYIWAKYHRFIEILERVWRTKKK